MNLRGHDRYFTIGLNIGESDCPLPTCGIRWDKTVWPIVISEWETEELPGSAFTTVANWRDYSWVEWRGTWYAQKAEAFKAVIDLPSRVSTPIEVCLSIADSDSELPLLRENGWRLVSPRERVGNADSYRRYIHGSPGEFSPVRPICSLGRNGWFSDRSGCYLAAGRPVIMEDTGLGRHLPVGAGLLTYTDVSTGGPVPRNRGTRLCQTRICRAGVCPGAPRLRPRASAHLGHRGPLMDLEAQKCQISSPCQNLS